MRPLVVPIACIRPSAEWLRYPIGCSPYGVDFSPVPAVTTYDFNFHVPSTGFPFATTFIFASVSLATRQPGTARDQEWQQHRDRLHDPLVEERSRTDVPDLASARDCTVPAINGVLALSCR